MSGLQKQAQKATAQHYGDPQTVYSVCDLALRTFASRIECAITLSPCMKHNLCSHDLPCALVTETQYFSVLH